MCRSAPDDLIHKAELKRVLELVENVPRAELERLLAALQRGSVSHPPPIYDRPQKTIIWES